MKNRIVFEDGLLRAMEDIEEQAEDDTTKMLSELLKSAILKPYKAAYYRELAKGRCIRRMLRTLLTGDSAAK